MAEPSITFNPREFHRKLSEIQGYFAELYYIDTAMAFLEKEEASWWHQTPVGPGTHYIEARFGTTFPFTKIYHVPADYVRLPWHESRKEEVEEHLQTLANDAETWAATEVNAITTRVKPYTWPVGAWYESQCIQPILSAHDMLTDEVSADFGKLSHSLGNWEGDAADNFATNFYNPFEHTLRSQKQLLTALAAGVTAAKAIAESTQHSLINVVHYTGEALREQLELAQSMAELARQESLRNILVIAGGAATVFGGILGGATATAGGLWVASSGVVAGGVSIAATTIPDGGWAALDLQGSTAADLLRSVSDAIGQIIENDSDQHAALRDVTQEALNRVDSLRSGDEDGRLIPVEPNILSGVDGTDFYLP
ncbi:hypothetical protein EDC02_2135 [Micromonospora sp. Llam0]|uniref:hypothetical protein n=1 Tax=Micromonospora sp. Llam0 TaxID=2485143 RepID=UPI000F474058|nr:hypothetical protein [Micromonospora sp. Llam0]ROO60276.1 hypothetical protein EDC02_2135 [Micromonospora sp. Llam0]